MAIAVCSAALCTLAAPPFNFWPFAFLCWVPLIIAIDTLRWTQAAVIGLVQGFVTNVTTQSWVIEGLQNGIGMGMFASTSLFIIFALWQGARTACLAMLVMVLVSRGWSRILVFPICLVTVEFVYPMVFPWFTGIFVNTKPIWLQLAEFGGPLIISAWLAVVNVCLAESVLRRNLVSRVKAMAVGIITIMMVTYIGWFCIKDVQQSMVSAPNLNVGVIQSDIDKMAIHQRDPVPLLREESLSLVRDTSLLDLIIWPETSVSYPIHIDKLMRFFRDHALRDRRDGSSAENISVPLLTGMVLKNEAEVVHQTGIQTATTPATVDQTILTNSAVLADPSGMILGIYDKQQLVPIGEKALFSGWFERMNSISPPATTFEIIRPVNVLMLKSVRILVSICYEDILHRSFRSNVRKTTPDLLINLTSDNWFKGSPAGALHFALAKLRAIEHRRFLIRSTNDGPTAAIAPTGEVVWQVPENKLARGVVTVKLFHRSTIYEKYGDFPYFFILILAMMMLIIGPSRGLLIEN